VDFQNVRSSGLKRHNKSLLQKQNKKAGFQNTQEVWSSDESARALLGVIPYNHESSSCSVEEELFQFRMLSSCALCIVKSLGEGHSQKNKGLSCLHLARVGPLILRMPSIQGLLWKFGTPSAPTLGSFISLGSLILVKHPSWEYTHAGGA
jgi:hypothetical protein